jgi:hypothetical protein
VYDEAIRVLAKIDEFLQQGSVGQWRIVDGPE